MRALFVDDEVMVSNLVCAILAQLGYETIQAGDGAEALELAERFPCNLVVTDFQMPRMNGRDLIEALVARRYETRYLLISGRIDECQGLGVPVLAKPFTASKLIQAVTLLEQAANRRPTRSELEQEAAEARKSWLKAIAEAEAAIEETHTSIAGDGALAIKKAGEKRTAAYNMYRKKLRELQEMDSFKLPRPKQE